MRMARIARGDSPRALHQARAIATGIGALFLRSYERGERVYAAMLSRGFDGKAPDLAVIGAPPRAAAAQWVVADAAGRRSGHGVGGGVGDADDRDPHRGDYGTCTRTGRWLSTASTSTVAAGERVAVLGPNGAGKTTLMLHLNGVLTATTGSVQISGIPLDAKESSRHPQARRAGVPGPRRSAVHAHGRSGRRIRPANFGLRGERARRPGARAPLAVVSLTEDAERSPTHLSAGQRRRAALATVLACRPDILVLDEPSANLDPVARRELAETLRDSTPPC